MNENELYFSYFAMINLIFLFIHVYFCFNFITYANRYIIAIINYKKHRESCNPCIKKSSSTDLIRYAKRINYYRLM